MGPSGIGLVVMKEELIGHAWKETPLLYDFAAYDKAPGTFPNTPNNWGIYMIGLYAAHMLKEGIPAIEKRNRHKAKLIYDVIDNSNGFYQSTVVPKYRSIMNIPFRIAGSKQLEEKFAMEANGEGMQNLEGHMLVGGCRATIYNAMPTEGVEKLVAFMKDFQARNAPSAKL